MGLVKTVGDKLDGKMKSGELKESELIAEATDIMNKMKNMPGMDNIQAMLSKMGMGGMAGMAGLGGKGGKVNMASMEAQLSSVQNDFNSFKKEPAGKKISDGKTDFNKQLNSDDVVNDRLAAITAMRKK